MTRVPGWLRRAPHPRGARLRRRSRPLALGAPAIAILVLAAGRWHAAPRPAARPAPAELPALDALPAAQVRADPEEGRLVISLPPVDLPAAAHGHIPMTRLPLYQAIIPVDASLYAARVEMVDARGRRLPTALLHHFNLSDPGRRELFLPIGLHILAASKETPELRVPGLVFGLPLARGQRLITSAMVHNPTSRAYRGVRVQLVLDYREPGRIFPLYEAFPWVMDVMFPIGQQPGGSKAFDLPPGRSSRSWDASPAVPGRIVGLGGHLHDFGVALELKDVTDGTVLWRGEPIRDSTGQVLQIPTKMFYGWRGIGTRVYPEHRYRLTVFYDNPTGRVLKNGGMGAVAGLFIPDDDADWPAVDTTDADYRQDLLDTMNPGGPVMMMEHGAH
ncbi:MAG TPA: hypothetical protein VFQ38_01350 [Longimicrobiales bacterium]|nr:hypothetical protein [Longimicrobiales bacterium]